MHRENAFAPKLTAASLISLGRVGIAVAKDDRSRIERRKYDLGNGLGTVRKHERHLSGRGNRSEGSFGFRVEQNRADSISKRCPARLPQTNDLVALLLPAPPQDDATGWSCRIRQGPQK